VNELSYASAVKMHKYSYGSVLVLYNVQYSHWATGHDAWRFWMRIRSAFAFDLELSSALVPSLFWRNHTAPKLWPVACGLWPCPRVSSATLSTRCGAQNELRGLGRMCRRRSSGHQPNAYQNCCADRASCGAIRPLTRVTPKVFFF